MRKSDEISSCVSTTGRQWCWLKLNSSVLLLLHGHGNSGASMVDQSMLK